MKPLLNLHQIEAFRAVMVAGSMVGAATLLNVTQPGISRTIGLMELRIGYKLFERRGRRLLPTPEAEALYREVEQMFASVDRIAQVAHDIRFQRAGALRIGTLPALAQGMVPRAIKRFLATRPNVEVFVQSLPSRQIAEMVSTRQFDIGIVELPLSHPAIDIDPLEPVHSMAVMPATHRLASQSRISLKDLDGERMILLSKHTFVRYQIDDAFSNLGVTPDVVIETPSSSIACALVAAGAGISLVSRWTASPFVGPDIVIRPVVEKLVSRYAIIQPTTIVHWSLADAFATDIKEEIGLFGRGSE